MAVPDGELPTPLRAVSNGGDEGGRATAGGGEGGGGGSGAGGTAGRVNLLLLLSLVTVLSLAENVRHYFAGPPASDGVRAALGVTAREEAARRDDVTGTPKAPTGALVSARSKDSWEAEIAGAPREPLSPRDTAPLPLDANELSVFLMRSWTDDFRETTWGALARGWNRTAQYDDFFNVSKPVPSLPFADGASGFGESASRPIMMIHCGPKTGSTTLRAACRRELERSCGISRKTGGFNPLGYMDEAKLYPLMRKCTNTHHFCAKEVDFPHDVPVFGNTTFVHLFPFRNYDEWAKSALKQQYDRGREKGCNNTRDLLERCKHNHMELDFRKYGKTELARFKEGVLWRTGRGGGDGGEERHVFVLYHHRDLASALKRVGEAYGVPPLRGSDGKGKEKRPEGTCDPELLDMYHDCFSAQLMELT
ncbi:hypothetical protein ACHAWF_014319 [Thalassiosira exigua]